MVRKKSKSKRSTYRVKYGIQRKARAHRKKLKKYARQHPELLNKGTKKDPGVPSLWPFKERLLAAQERRSEKLSDEQQRQKQSRRDRQQAARRRQALEAAQADTQEQGMSLRLNDKDSGRRKWFQRELKQVLEEADVLLEVLDARDPLGFRCPQIERLVLGQLSQESVRPKRIILVLNKIDLVPPEVALAWTEYLSREFPTIAFKASTQQQSANLARSTSRSLAGTIDAAHQSGAGGVPPLMNLLKQYSIKLGIKTAITVGVIGYPNVGKSSIINSLLRSRKVGVGATPGFTRTIQHVRLDKHLTLLDSPGVLFASESSDPAVALRNCLRVEQITDPHAAVSAILSRADHAQLMALYSIAKFRNVDEFLFRIAHKRGRLGRGGVPQLEAAARDVLVDWNRGKIPFYSLPPAQPQPQPQPQHHHHQQQQQQQPGGIPTPGPAVQVAHWLPDFDVSAMAATINKQVIGSATAPSSTPFVQMQSSAPMDDDDDLNMDGEDGAEPFSGGFVFAPANDEDGDAGMQVDSDEEEDDDDDSDSDEDLAGNTARNRALEAKTSSNPLTRRRTAQKQAKKKAAKEARRLRRQQEEEDEQQQQQQQHALPAPTNTNTSLANIAYSFDDWE